MVIQMMIMEYGYVIYQVGKGENRLSS